jgi:hypothetical protein
MPLLSSYTETALFNACRTLFGSDINLSRDFLLYLQPEGAKSAYRIKAKKTHPDLFTEDRPALRKKRNELFQELAEAYELVCDFLKQRESGQWPLKRCGSPSAAASTKTPPPGGQKQNDSLKTYYQGTLPFRTFEFGLYLYCRGAIPYQALISALVWQRNQRPAIGQIAFRWGWLNETDIRAINRYRGSYGRFGRRAVKLGLLTPFQAQTLIRYQQTLQKKLGWYFIEQGLLTPFEVERHVSEMQAHNSRVFASMNKEQGGFEC